MIVMRGGSRRAMDDAPVDAQSYARAILNILDDSAEEKIRLGDTQRAILNILDDSAGEKTRLEATQRAILNILDDSAEEKIRLGDTQRAILNILDDFDIEKKKVERVNVELRSEIAERTRAEEALRHANAVAEAANAELEAFSYSVSHDLRAPLRAIDGFSQALLEDYAGGLDDQGRDHLQRVRDGSQRMAHLIDDMLKLSRVTRAGLRQEEVDLSALAQDIAAELRRGHPDREVEFSTASGLRVHGDPRLLRIAIENLLDNAWKFTRGRNPARIELGVRPEPDGKPAYFMRDNGVGFDMAYSGRLFGAFQRLHGAREFPGTGIGLATVQRVIHKHGGKVWAEGAVGKGATFFFTL
jgi:light-regulated signal transduction histidine kinase (bacteriophytochrome)